MLHNGLYEQIINKGLDAELSVTDKLSQTAPIDSAEASKVLSKYVAEIVEKGLNNVKDIPFRRPMTKSPLQWSNSWKKETCHIKRLV